MPILKIGVGIIGANPHRGWAASAHIPAVRSLPQFKFVALSTSRKESAAEAARKFGVALAFDNYRDLLSRPEVDLAVVSVKVLFHMELAGAALQARKAVYCEWPLGNGLAEASQLAAMAHEKGVVARVGLQARSSPVVNQVRHLLADGYIGTVLSSYSMFLAMNRTGAPTASSSGRYIDRMEKRSGRWAIAARICIRDWAPLTEIAESLDQSRMTIVQNQHETIRALMRNGPQSCRDHNDISYQRPLTISPERVQAFRDYVARQARG